MKTNKKLKYGKLFTSITLFIILSIAVAVGIVTVFALTQRSVDSSIFIRYTATDIDGSVNATYQLIGKESKDNGEVVDMGTINFAVTDGKSDHEISPAEDLKLTKATPYIEFTYIFTNNGSRDFTATVSLKDVVENNNISFNYAYQNYDYLDENFSILVQGVETGKNVVTYKIKMGVESFAKNAGFKGALFWDLKTPEIEDESTQMSVNSLNFTDKSDGTYSATYNGGEIKDKTLVIPSEVNGAKITSVGNVRNLPYGSKVILSEGITSIKEKAFQYSGMGSITLPDSLEDIGYESFYYNSIASITIPKSVINIGTGIFTYCEHLTEIIVDEDNPVYSSVNNCLMKGTILVAGCKTSTIPSNTTEILSNAFSAIPITSIHIPKSVTSIGESVFSMCSKIESITADEGGVYTAEENCLIYNTTLIRGCENSKIPNYVTIISGSSFNNTSITSIIIPDSVEIIQVNAFYSCAKLEVVVLSNNIKSIGPYAFDGCKIKELTIPASVNNIDSNAFTCKTLTKVYILANSGTISNNAFKNVTATIYCVAPSKPSTWGNNWAPNATEIIWGYNP